LHGLIDSCAGVTLGYKKYHQAIARMYPQFIRSYVNFSKENYREEYIGGINGGPPSVTVTAAIDYILPYEVQGAHSTIRVALSDQMAMNTIFGILFQKKCGFNLNFQNDTVTSPVFAETYKIEYVHNVATRATKQSGRLLCSQDREKQIQKVIAFGNGFGTRPMTGHFIALLLICPGQTDGVLRPMTHVTPLQTTPIILRKLILSSYLIRFVLVK